MRNWIIGAILAAIFWFISSLHFVDTLNSVPMIAQLQLNFRTVFVQIGALCLMFPIIQWAFLTPLQEAIHERNSHLEHTFAEAESLRNEMGQMRTDYERRLAQTEADARAQIQAQIKEAQQLRQMLMSEAAEKADELVKRANQEIEAEKMRVMGELRLGVVNLTLQATEKLLGESIDSAKNRRLVEEFIDKIEVKA